MRALILLAVLSSTAACSADVVCVLDAAECYADGTPMTGMAAWRAIIDNSEGTTALTNVRFHIEVHDGTVGGSEFWSFDDPTSPWCGAGELEMIAEDQHIRYVGGLICYPQTMEFAPGFTAEYLPGHPLYTGDPYRDTKYLFDTIPAGFVWDVPVKLIGWLGCDIELFSTATGQLDSNETTIVMTDTDPLPQTAVPEPSSLLLLSCGLLCLRRRAG